VDVAVETKDALARVRIATVVGDAWLGLVTSGDARTELAAGRRAPIQGWVSSCYGERRPAPVLEVEVDGELPVVAFTRLRWGGSAEVMTVERGRRELRLRLDHGGGLVDDLVLGHGGGEGELVWRRRRQDTVTHRMAAGTRGLTRLESQED
jgi:hypothetical protein